jgi:dTDP-4-amino-4,6-dideoxygalactose transaminase
MEPRTRVTTIPLVDLKAQYHSIKTDIDAAVSRALENCTFILGPDVEAFEKDFAAYSEAAYGIGVNSGTSALHLALLAAGVGPGDEVITTPFTFLATAAAIRYVGAIPVFADIDPLTYTIDPAEIEPAVTPRTKAILPVHLYGHPADMDPILEIARKYNLVVIEDAAQAHGALYKGKRVGNIGQLGAFSFFPTKNLGAGGEGGMVLTSNPEYEEKLRKIRNWGQETRYHYKYRGFNYRLEGIQGAILRAKLPYLERWTEARRSHAAYYNQAFADAGLPFPIEQPWVRHVRHVYPLRSLNRDLLQQQLAEAGILTAIYYPVPIHLMDIYADLGIRAGQFPHAEAASREELSIPVYPELTDAQTEYIAGIVRKSLAQEAECLSSR